MAKKIVMKFGGTSVGNADAIKQAAAQVLAARREGHNVVVVVSAMRGVTDALINATMGAATGNHAAPEEAKQFLWEKHHEVAVQLLPDGYWDVLGAIEAELSNFSNLATAIGILGEVTRRAMDFVSSLGERFSAMLVADYLSSLDCPAAAVMADSVIVTDSQFGNANPLLDLTGERASATLLPMWEHSVTPVVTGFLGATRAGIVTTLGRGGSDYTASILGHALDADEIWIWSDVDGVLTADPRIVPGAHSIRQLSYKEAAELAYFGAKVLHPKTVRPAVEKGIPIRMLNTFNPTHAGTWITSETTDSMLVKAVTHIPALTLVTVEGRGMLGVPGVAARVFGTVAQIGTSVLMISQGSSEQSICFVVAQDESDAVRDALEETFRAEIMQGNIDRVWGEEQVAIIAVVGGAMRGTPGIAGRLFTALGDAQINVLSIAQGSSEYNVSFVVEHAEAHRAVRAIHEAVVLGKQTQRRGWGSVSVAQTISLIQLGLGGVGRALVQQVHATRDVQARLGIALRYVALADSSGALVGERGLAESVVESAVRFKARGGALHEHEAGYFHDGLAALVDTAGQPHTIVVDTTAADPARLLPAFELALGRGYALALANKKPLTASWDAWQWLTRDGRIGYEATVGAGLPIISTLRSLLDTGDEVRRIEGAFSGTLGFLMSELQEGADFAASVRAAKARGWTEPDPRDDLSGTDVARKALILARTLGIEAEMADVTVEPLYPAAWAALPLDEFMARLDELSPLLRGAAGRRAGERAAPPLRGDRGGGRTAHRGASQRVTRQPAGCAARAGQPCSLSHHPLPAAPPRRAGLWRGHRRHCQRPPQRHPAAGGCVAVREIGDWRLEIGDGWLKAHVAARSVRDSL